MNPTPLHGDGSGFLSRRADCTTSRQPALRVGSPACDVLLSIKGMSFLESIHQLLGLELLDIRCQRSFGVQCSSRHIGQVLVERIQAHRLWRALSSVKASRSVKALL